MVVDSWMSPLVVILVVLVCHFLKAVFGWFGMLFWVLVSGVGFALIVGVYWLC